jgi:hypothetical protein
VRTLGYLPISRVCHSFQEFKLYGGAADGRAGPGSRAAKGQQGQTALSLRFGAPLSRQRQAFPCAHVPPAHCADSAVPKELPVWLDCAWRRGMPEQDAEFDYRRYRQLLAEAVDDRKRLAFIELLIQERAREKLQAQRASDRMAMTVATITTVLASAPG